MPEPLYFLRIWAGDYPLALIDLPPLPLAEAQRAAAQYQMEHAHELLPIEGVRLKRANPPAPWVA